MEHDDAEGSQRGWSEEHLSYRHGIVELTFTILGVARIGHQERQSCGN